MLSTRILLTLALTGLMLSGCGGDRRDLEQWVEQTMQRPPVPVDPIPQVVMPQPVVYNAYELRDPFLRPRVTEMAATGGDTEGPRPDPDRRREFLEQFPLDALQMVGTIELGPEEVYGLVSDAEGVIHRVQEGNYLGQNHGRIRSISPVAIELVELVPDGGEGWNEREARIALPEQG